MSGLVMRPSCRPHYATHACLSVSLRLSIRLSVRSSNLNAKGVKFQRMSNRCANFQFKRSVDNKKTSRKKCITGNSCLLTVVSNRLQKFNAATAINSYTCNSYVLPLMMGRKYLIQLGRHISRRHCFF